MPDPDPRLVEGPQGPLRVSDGGTGGLAVVLIHGGAAELGQWSAQLDHLRRRCRAVALDLRGMGGSRPARDGDYSLPAMAADVHAVALALGLGRFALVGHSYGGAVISAYAASHPERLAALVYADCHGVPWIPTPEERRELDEGFRPENFAAFTERWYEAILANAVEGTRRRVMASLRATPREVFIASVEGGIGFDPRAAVAGFPGPLLAIGAEMLDGPQAAQRALPVRDFRVMKGVSHWLMMDRPEEFNRHLDELLAGLR